MDKNVNLIKLLDVVALLRAFPEENLIKGEVGTVVEQLSENAFEVEFSNKQGQTINSIVLNPEDFIVLYFEGAVVV